MAKNVFVKVPSYGDVVVGDKESKKILFIAHESFSLQDLNQDKYEIQGVVGARHGRRVIIIAKNNAAKAWSDKIIVEIKDVNLDGAEHDGTINYKTEQDWSKGVSVVVTYSATSLQQVANAINEAVLTQSEMVKQNWHAFVREEKLLVSFSYLNWQQVNNTFTGGFAKNSDYYFGNVPHFAKLRWRSGYEGGYGAVISMNRAITWYRASTGAEGYDGNATSDITDLSKKNYPVNLTTYLGKAADGNDYCAALRRKYGEGERGWLNCMKAFEVVCPTDFGNMGIRNGLEITKKMAAHTEQNGVSISPAADYCIRYGTEILPAGNWYLPTVEDLKYILSNIKYDTESVDNCPINSSLKAIGGDYVRNSTYAWSCCRYSWVTAYVSNGHRGYLDYNSLYSRNQAVPVSLYYIED